MADSREIVAKAICEVEGVRAFWSGKSTSYADLDEGQKADQLVVADAVLTALREAGSLHEWRPIEEAPKDGTSIIAYCVHVNAKYATNSIQEGWEYPVIAKWIDHNGGGWTWHGMAGTFTHYMPLPPAPGAAK